MSHKPKSFCMKCRAAHEVGKCPHRKAFDRKRSGSKSSGRGGRPWQSKRERIFERDKYICQLCLTKGLTVSVELHGPNHGVCDHVKAIAFGGTDDDRNLQTICQQCDVEKTQQESQMGRGGQKSTGI